MPTVSLLTAFILGMSSSLHCLGMCGGVIGALSIGLPQEVRTRRTLRAAIISAYNLGRIGSYMVAGAVAGTLGQLLFQGVAGGSGHLLLQIGAALVLVLLGLQIAGWLRGLTWLETAGLSLWRLIQPLGRYFLPVDSLPKALAVGCLWGWLPCGLVYTVMLWSAASGNAGNGALIMLAFGAGTLPSMLIAGFLGGGLQGMLRNPAWKRSLGIMVIILGLASPWLHNLGHARQPEPAATHQHH